MLILKNNNFIKSFLIYGLTSGISRFVSLLLIPLYVRIFSTSENGVIDMIQTIIQASMIFGLLQLESSLQRYYYELDNRNRKIMISTIIIFVFVLSLLISISLCLSADNISTYFFKTDLYSVEICIAAMIIPLINISILNFIILRYKKRSIVFSVITFIQVLLTSSLIILFSLNFKWGIKSVFIGQLFGYFFVIVAQFVYIKNDVGFIFNKEALKKYLKFSLPELPARIGSESVSRMNRFILITYLSTSALGIYAVAVKFASSIELINSAFIMSWKPYMYESLKTDNYKTKFLQIYKTTLYFSFFIIIFLSLYSPEIISLFTTREYYEAKFLLPGLFLFNGLYIIKSVVDIGPSVSKKMIYVTYIYFTVAIINIVFLFLGVKAFGLKGVVYALILTNFILIIFSWYITERIHPIGFEIKKFIIKFLLLSFIILILMNVELHLVIRVFINLFLMVFFLIYVLKNKELWRKLHF